MAKELSDNWKTGSSIDVMCDKDRVKCVQFLSFGSLLSTLDPPCVRCLL